MFRFIKKMAQSEINRATKNRESVKKHIRLELPPSVADFVSAPSGHLRSLSPPSLAAFPGNCSKPSQFPGAHSASWFKILCPLNKKNRAYFYARYYFKPTVGLEPAQNRRTVKNWAASAGQFRFIDIMATIKKQNGAR